MILSGYLKFPESPGGYIKGGTLQQTYFKGKKQVPYITTDVFQGEKTGPLKRAFFLNVPPLPTHKTEKSPKNPGGYVKGGGVR